jgi:hypothetical protein
VYENGAAGVTESRDLVAAVRTTKQFLTYVASGPFQYAIAEALALPDAYYTGLRDDLRAKRDLLATGLTDAGEEGGSPHRSRKPPPQGIQRLEFPAQPGVDDRPHYRSGKPPRS